MHWCWSIVSGSFDIVFDPFVKTEIRKETDGLWDVVSCSFHWNLFVFVEVDSGELPGEKFLLGAFVSWPTVFPFRCSAFISARSIEIIPASVLAANSKLKLITK